MSLRRMQNELEQWGAWAGSTQRTYGLERYESPCYSLLKRNVQQQGSGGGVLLDDDALIAIDALVIQLKMSRPDLYAVIHVYYLMGKSLREMARLTGESHVKIDQYLRMAETWLDCRLEALCEGL